MQYPYSRPSTSHSPIPSVRHVAGYKIIYLGKKKVYFNPKRYSAPNELGKSNEEKVGWTIFSNKQPPLWHVR